MSTSVLSQSSSTAPFDVTELTIDDFHSALLSGRTTCVAVILTYLDRISHINPRIHAIIHCISKKKAIHLAKQADDELKTHGAAILTSKPLLGVPAILKDTYLTSSLPTTNGSKSLVGLTSKNSPLVTRLEHAGAIIIAKANCHEFCLNGCTFSSLGGQTLNPYDFSRTPGGSSGGTGASIAANLGLVGCGGDTMNSIRSPASACNVVGFRPSNGLVGRTGIFPVSPTQDAAGPICRTVADCRKLFMVMKGRDEEDKATHHDRHSHMTGWPISPPRRLRIGLLKSCFPAPTEPDAEIVNAVMSSAISNLSEAHEIITIPEPSPSPFEISTLLRTHDVQSHELLTAFNDFLSSPYILSTPYKTLQDISASNLYDSRALSQVWHNALSAVQDPTSPYQPESSAHKQNLQNINNLTTLLEETMNAANIDVMIYPHQRRLVMPIGATNQEGRNGLLTSLTGFPSLCIPAGFSPVSESAPLGVPVGMEIVGRRWDDGLVLDVGEIFEGTLGMRRVPHL